jgi:hypothetical protein
MSAMALAFWVVVIVVGFFVVICWLGSVIEALDRRDARKAARKLGYFYTSKWRKADLDAWIARGRQ